MSTVSGRSCQHVWLIYAVAAVMAACESPAPAHPARSQTTAQGSTPPDRTGVVAGEIAARAPDYRGKRITVSGEVVDVWTPRAFTIGGPQFVGNHKLLIVSRTALPQIIERQSLPWLSPTDIVQVTGVVSLDSITELERTIGFDLAAAVEQLWRPGLPVVVADEVLVSARQNAR